MIYEEKGSGLTKTIWIDTSRAPDSEARKRLILAALEGGFGHIVKLRPGEGVKDGVGGVAGKLAA